MNVELRNGGLPRSRFFAARLRAKRIEYGLLQGEFAKRVGVSRSAAIQWENRRPEPSLAMIEKIAEAPGVTPEYLVFGIEVPDRVTREVLSPKSSILPYKC